MSKEIFCKIVETEKTQGLVVKGYDENSPEEFPCVDVTIKIEGLTVNQRLTFETEKAMEKAFEKIDEEAVLVIYNGVEEMLNQKEK